MARVFVMSGEERAVQWKELQRAAEQRQAAGVRDWVCVTLHYCLNST